MITQHYIRLSHLVFHLILMQLLPFRFFRNVQEPMFLLVVGNKIDLDERRAVSREEALIYAQSIGAKYLETSVVRDQVS